MAKMEAAEKIANDVVDYLTYMGLGTGTTSTTTTSTTPTRDSQRDNTATPSSSQPPKSQRTYIKDKDKKRAKFC
ncbi:hypothetical protein Scep_026054 [Stephania cephalantha]|uniref:Uncharacterized protein n=1 Tax=Stephania cephalantha TaxID=152367 RepID=A0AAP0EJD9_9MAGN